MNQQFHHNIAALICLVSLFGSHLHTHIWIYCIHQFRNDHSVLAYYLCRLLLNTSSSHWKYCITWEQARCFPQYILWRWFDEHNIQHLFHELPTLQAEPLSQLLSPLPLWKWLNSIVNDVILKLTHLWQINDKLKIEDRSILSQWIHRHGDDLSWIFFWKIQSPYNLIKYEDETSPTFKKRH